jgi:phospho-N-acetylmuramoyl-pentapeptide-transferase
MAALLGLTILSFFISIILFVPFIDFLYRAKLRRQHQETRDLFNNRTPIFDKFHRFKAGTPVGGGILIIVLTCVLTIWSYGILNVPTKAWEMFVIFFSIITFGALGMLDDWKKIADPGQKNVFFGLRFRHKFIIQWILALIIATVFYFELGYSFIYLHGIGLISIGVLFIPFAAFVIVSFVNAVNITDGLDGLSSGLLVICLVGFLAINSQQIDKSLGVFISILLGSVMAFLYFNIYKARIWLGDVGSLALGASLAVIGLLTGKTITIGVIGGVFIVEIASSLLQILSKKYLKKKLFPAAPFHLYLQQRGWEEPKIVMRAWLVGILFAVLGVYLAFLS